MELKATGPREFERIDFDAIRQKVKLRDILERDLGAPRRGRHVCPFHAEAEHHNLSVSRDGQRFRCWVCGAKGDVFDYIARRDGITLVEAARVLDPSAGTDEASSTRRMARQKARPPAPPVAWQDPAWQGAVERIVSEAAVVLWSRAGRGALQWLRARGLDDMTIRQFRLGFVSRPHETEPLGVLANDRGQPQPLRPDRGITIPWGHPDGWYASRGIPIAPRWVGCQVRRLTADFGDAPPKSPKYRALSRSERGHAYPLAHAVAGLPALVCEGEFDALLAWQELGHAVNVLTVGGVDQTPQPDATAILHDSPAWLLAFDHDANRAGDRGARKFSGLAPHKCRRLWLPGSANDLTDFHKAGGNLPDWLASEFKRFGWPWPSVAIATDSTAWRWRAANLPWERWLAWRQRSAELVDTGTATADAIHAADRQALAEVLGGQRPGHEGVADRHRGGIPFATAPRPLLASTVCLFIDRPKRVV